MTTAKLRLAACLALAVCLIGLAVRSLSSQMYQDAPIMLYAAWLIDRKHLIPYRDFFDMNMPGTYAANVIVGRLSGYSELGVRWVDLLSLSVLLAATYAAMRRFGPITGLFAALFVGVFYLASGPWVSLQREYLLLLPVSAALAVVMAPEIGSTVKAGLAGFLIGTAATIKPQALLALPVILAYVGAESRAQGAQRRWLPAGAIGFAVPLIVMAGYLWREHALASFTDIVVNYWPAYNALSGSPQPHVILGGAVRVRYLLSNAVAFGPHPGLPLLAAGSIGAAAALHRSSLAPADRRAVWMLLGLTVAFWLYVIVAGKFWVYHWLPFNYAAILLGSLALAGPPTENRRQQLRTLAVLLLMSIGLTWSFGPLASPDQPAAARVREIRGFLQQHLEPGDTVAPLDWTEGAVHAMLLAQAPPAAPFLYDFHFYHHVSSPYVQQLRRRFLASLAGSPPRFIIRIDRPGRFAGPDTTASFDELAAFVRTRYDLAAAGSDYQIWERQTGAHGQ